MFCPFNVPSSPSIRPSFNIFPDAVKFTVLADITFPRLFVMSLPVRFNTPALFNWPLFTKSSPLMKRLSIPNSVPSRFRFPDVDKVILFPLIVPVLLS